MCRVGTEKARNPPRNFPGMRIFLIVTAAPLFLLLTAACGDDPAAGPAELPVRRHGPLVVRLAHQVTPARVAISP